MIQNDNDRDPQRPPVLDIEPVSNRLLCRRVPFDQVLKSVLIVLPAEHADRHKTRFAYVLRQGPLVEGAWAGKHVVTGLWAGTDIPCKEDEDLFICRPDEILATLP
jgi:co-chaperonin GroES (HSP10)